MKTLGMKKTISCTLVYFNTYGLDVFFLVTNAPGRSAFNRVKRRMAPLSKELCSVLLEPLLEFYW